VKRPKNKIFTRQRKSCEKSKKFIRIGYSWRKNCIIKCSELDLRWANFSLEQAKLFQSIRWFFSFSRAAAKLFYFYRKKLTLCHQKTFLFSHRQYFLISRNPLLKKYCLTHIILYIFLWLFDRITFSSGEK
jgi:hypothetical protein